MKSGLGQIESSIRASYKFLMSKDWVKYILGLPLQFNPSEKFDYNSSNTHILSAILTRATGMKASVFAQKYLFDQLGIKEYIWEEDSNGNNFGSGNLYLNPYDMGKIGYLILNNGQWGNQQIISKSWLEEALTRYTKLDYGYYYGYLWYIKDEGDRDLAKKYVTYSAAGAEC
jgi:CubicO group peptidase (beta-lactamase class C family)